jgi:hypothetical protein
MGANHSFNAELKDTYWDQVITALLDKGYWVTLDYQAHEHSVVLKMLNPGVWQCRTFVPLLGVRIPHIQTSNPNLTVKIDDVDFKATNPGVWCMHFHEVTDSNRFTDWQDYESDEVVTSQVDPVEITPLVNTINERKVVHVEVEGDVDVESIKTAVETATLNDSTIGIDPNSKSQLKPGDEGEVKAPVITSTTDATEAYAEGTKEDPLSKAEKKTKVKKTEA